MDSESENANCPHGKGLITLGKVSLSGFHDADSSDVCHVERVGRPVPHPGA